LRSDALERGTLTCERCRQRHPVIDFIPRFAPGRTYADSFGFQWNRFRSTQLDSHSGAPISRDRFFRETGWVAGEVAGKKVMDVGCGAGRFAEIALETGAEVTAVDYSNAVEACFANLGLSPGLNVVQADLYRLPFEPEGFDYVYCFGVLQHTPDPAGAVAALARQVRPGGRLVVDVYPKTAATFLWPKYWLRPITRRLPSDLLFRLVRRGVPVLIPVSRLLARVPRIGGRLRYLVPIMDYEGRLPLSPKDLREWAILDTFDMYAPAFDRPQTPEAVRSWFERAGLEQVEVFSAGFLVGRAVKGEGRREAS
jgi:SAM-dependent methyltransferase